MKRRLVFWLAVFCLGFPFSGKAQLLDKLINTVDDGLSVTYFIQEANLLVMSAEALVDKMKGVEKQLAALKEAMKTSEDKKAFREEQLITMSQKIKFYTMQVTIYGKAVRFLLRQLQEAIVRHAAAQATKQSLEAKELLDDLQAQVSDAAAVLSGETDLSPVTKKISVLSSKQELQMTLQQATKFVEGGNIKIIELSGDLDNLLYEMMSLEFVLHSSLGAQVLFTMGSFGRRLEASYPNKKKN